MMSKARPFIRYAKQFVCFALFVFIAVEQAGGKACPPPPPKPLRVLYQESDKVVVARVESFTKGETVTDEYYTRVRIRKVLNVGQTLKGKPEPYLILLDWEYQDKNISQEPIQNAAVAADAETAEEIVAGQTAEAETTEESATEDETGVGKRLLLFLKKDGEDDGYNLTYYDKAAKELNDADLDVYLKRVAELDAVLASPNDRAERIVEWLLKCAAEPATRWEGAYELETSFEQLGWEKEYLEKQRETQARGETTLLTAEQIEYRQTIAAENTMRYDAAEQDQLPDAGDTSFAAVLSGSQKERLTDYLLAHLNTVRTQRADSEKAEETGLSEGDSQLLDLVKRWDKPRIAPHLLASLRNGAGLDKHDSGRFMTMLAELTEDSELSALVTQYDEILYNDDTAEETEETSESEAAAEQADEQPSADTTDQTESSVEGEPEQEQTQTKQQSKLSWHEQRQNLILTFVALCDALGQSAAVAQTN